MKVTILCKCKNNFGTFSIMRNGAITIPPCPKCSAAKPPVDQHGVFADTLANKWADYSDAAFFPHTT
jgi:hypothetical protein